MGDDQQDMQKKSGSSAEYTSRQPQTSRTIFSLIFSEKDWMVPTTKLNFKG